MIYLCNGRICSVARFETWNVNKNLADPRLEPASTAHSVIVCCQDTSRSSGTYEVRPAVQTCLCHFKVKTQNLGVIKQIITDPGTRKTRFARWDNHNCT